ncbi:hypothetical protein Tsubulata_011889, partial [Turnera subulata]
FNNPNWGSQCMRTAYIMPIGPSYHHPTFYCFTTISHISISTNTMALTLENKLIFAVLLVIGLCASQAWSRSLNEASMNERHEMWMAKYGRVYKDTAEKERRLKTFKANVEYIESSNRAGIKPYKLAINEFADLTNKEFQASRNGYIFKSLVTSSSFKYENVTAVPSTMDWRTKGAVTPIKDQGQCGCCWAFSAVAAMEGITKLSTGKLISLSEQELVDCDTSGEDQGCNGGLMDDAFEFIIKNKGLTTESNYPYEATDGSCNKAKSGSHAAQISGYEDVPANNEAALMKAVANQPMLGDRTSSSTQAECLLEIVELIWTMESLQLDMEQVMMVPTGVKMDTLECKETLMPRKAFVALPCSLPILLLKLQELIFAVLLVVVLCASQAWSRSLNELSMNERHEMWMGKYGRVYKDNAEKERRLKTFKANVEYIESSNRAGIKPYKLAINEFADLTNEEFQESRNGYRFKPSVTSSSFKYENVTAVPSTMDWRTKGAVTPIKDQGQCGCCWAFSAVAAMEGITKLSTGKLISLSEQELVDCDTSGEDQGCNGGLMDDAFEFIIKNKGLTTESNYPYDATDGSCNKAKSGSHAAQINGYEDVPADNEAALMKAVANQPVSVAIDAGGSDFQFYSSGVFTGDCGTDLDHGVTAVGYGTSDDGTKYWLAALVHYLKLDHYLKLPFEKRFNIFKANLHFIESFNKAGNRTYKLGLNAFADLTNDEFRASRNRYRQSSSRPATFKVSSFRYANIYDLPETVDWREKGAVTPVKNQLNCGCCWAFSAVAAVEGITKIKTQRLISLSEQELVDCDIRGEDAGCNGGDMDSAFYFIIQNKGITTEAIYPFRGVNGICQSRRAAFAAAKIKGYEDVPTENEKALMQAVAHQPVSAAIDSSGMDFQFYESGIFTGECEADLDHGIAVVGYGKSNGTKYWLVKNSWGTTWGEKGYIRMRKDIRTKHGICGIAKRASYPT